MKTVLLDVDGVLADFVAAYLQLVKDVTGREFKHENVTEFDICKALGLSAEDAAAIKKGITQGWCSTLEPLPGAKEAVAHLNAIADVYIVTSPWNSCPTWMYERERWVSKHFGIPHAKVLHGSAKHLVAGDMLVDDKTSTLVKWRDHNPGKAPILWESPWNVRDEWAGVLTNDWDRVVRIVEALP